MRVPLSARALGARIAAAVEPFQLGDNPRGGERIRRSRDVGGGEFGLRTIIGARSFGPLDAQLLQDRCDLGIGLLPRGPPGRSPAAISAFVVSAMPDVSAEPAHRPPRSRRPHPAPHPSRGAAARPSSASAYALRSAGGQDAEQRRSRRPGLGDLPSTASVPASFREIHSRRALAY